MQYHAPNDHQMALHSVGPFSLSHCGYPDLFGHHFWEKIPYYLAIAVGNGSRSTH